MTRRFEQFYARRAAMHFTVTNAMRDDLAGVQWGKIRCVLLLI